MSFLRAVRLPRKPFSSFHLISSFSLIYFSGSSSQSASERCFLSLSLLNLPARGFNTRMGPWCFIINIFPAWIELMQREREIGMREKNEFLKKISTGLFLNALNCCLSLYFPLWNIQSTNLDNKSIFLGCVCISNIKNRWNLRD